MQTRYLAEVAVSVNRSDDGTDDVKVETSEITYPRPVELWRLRVHHDSEPQKFLDSRRINGKSACLRRVLRNVARVSKRRQIAGRIPRLVETSG
jgi:hypothetical protein